MAGVSKECKTEGYLRERILVFLIRQLPRLEQDFIKLNSSERLKARDRLAVFERFLKHVLAPPTFDLSKMSENDLDLLIERLRSQQLTSWQKVGQGTGAKAKELINN